MSVQKTITILRHAKADSGSPMQDDHERNLNERGQQAATALGNYLAKRASAYDQVLCSTAQRTRQTLGLLHLEPLPAVQYLEKLYLASANELCLVLSELPDSVSNLLLVGHNPGVHQLCLKLSKTGDEALIDTMALKFPTCTLARIGFEGGWKNLVQDGGQLLEFMTPKVLALQEED